MGRAPCCDKTKVRKGSWSPEEDKILMNYIQQNGTGGNWIALPHKAGLNRCGKSCRLRWLNYLRPDIKHGNFTVEEDYVIYSLYNTIGSRWSVIASNLPGRTDNDVKNYWNTKLKKEIFPSSKNNITTFNNNGHNRFDTTTTNTNTPTTTSVQSMSAPVELESQIFDHKDPNFSKFSTDSMDMINYNYYYEREFEHEKMGFDQMDRREKISATNNNSFSGSSSTSVPQISSNSGSGSGLSTTTSSMGTCNALSEDEINNSYNGIAPATTWEEDEEMKRVMMNGVATEGGDDEFWMELFLSSSLFSDDQFYTDSDDVIVSGYDLQDKMSEVASILHGSSHHLSSLPN